MKVKFWGVRGSIPVPGKEFAHYGGNTSCVEVRCGDTIIILDAGTGIRELGISLLKERGSNPTHINILVSHTHWDHIQGFPYLPHIYLPGHRITFYGGHSVSTLEKLIMVQMSEEYHPKTLFELTSPVDFVELKSNVFQIDEVQITTTHLLHPGLSLGFRIEYRNHVIAYVTDNEIIADSDSGRYNWENIGNIINNADLLIHDGQYTRNEYLNKVGWGHSDINRVVDISNHYGVKELQLFHHDPTHTDKDLRLMVAEARKSSTSKMRIFAAREKEEFYF